jgi:glycosyltransferase involved in cell wall biosynthesis
MPAISVILATRDRPASFAVALSSVLAQSLENIEIVVVNDGSEERHCQAYADLLAEVGPRLGERLQGHSLVPRPRGHGASYARNFGVAHARGEHVCFLDDDDCWTDRGYLARVARVIEAGGASAPVELVFANQAAYSRAGRLPGPLWLGDLARELEAAGRARRRPDGAFRVEVGDLMATRGFCHLNTLTVRRALYETVGGMDEAIRWESDRDLYLRLIDRAAEMRYLPDIVSRHNVPDPEAATSVTTRLSMIDRRLQQVRVLDKAALFAEHAEIRRHGLRHKGYALKSIAEELAAAGRPALALRYAREALGLQPTVKWAGFTALLALRGIGQRL